MSQVTTKTKSQPKNNLVRYSFVAIFILVLVIGLYIVKWSPYYGKAVKIAKPGAGSAKLSSIIVGKTGGAPAFSWAAAKSYFIDYFTAVWKAVVLGLLLGSLVQVALPKNWIKKAFGSKKFGSTAAAGAASLPGMMCTCCAAPVAVGLRKRSASINSALAFFIGNPVLNPYTIIFMGFVLGWNFAVFRIIVGVILVLGVATIAPKFAGGEEAISSVISKEDEEEAEEVGSFLVRWVKALVKLIIDTIPAYLIVVVVLGAIRVWLFPVLGSAWVNGILGIIVLAVTGTMFVIPTAAEVPLIQTLMGIGLGAGPAGALLITLPAISLPSLLIVKRAFPRRVLIFVASAVAVMGIISGILAAFVL